MVTVHQVFFDDHIPNWYNPLIHVQYHYLVLILQGRLHYRLNGERRMAKKGDLVFIPAGTLRESHNDKESTHQKFAVAFTFPSAIDLPLLNNGQYHIFHTRYFEYFKERFATLYRNHLEHRLYHETMSSGILLELIGWVCLEMDTPQLPKRKLHAVQEIETYILHHYRETLTIGQLANLIRRSPNYTITLFKEAVGQTPLAYQHHLRMTAAKELLLSTKLSITEIANHLGYYDASYFYKMFRKSTGVSPSEYAKRLDTSTKSINSMLET